MSTERTSENVLADLAAAPRRDDLARLVHTLLFSAADERRTRLSDGLAELSDRMGLTAKDAETIAGNVATALSQSKVAGLTSPEAALLGALLARGVALSPPEGEAAEARVVDSLVWLAANTPVDALSAIDAALGDRAAGIWHAAGGLVRRVEEGGAPHQGRAEAMIAAAALRASGSKAAQAEVSVLVGEARDPAVRALLGRGDSGGAGAASDVADGGSSDGVTTEGELVPAPHGPVAFVLLAFTGILAVMHVGRLFGRWVLRYRRPASMRVSARGVTVKAKTEMLGRTLRERELFIPVESLLRATREVRFPRLAMYAGLFALAVGSYLGMVLFVDGVRVGSPELLGMGALLVALGIGLDFALVALSSRSRGRCRLIIVPRRGPALAMGSVDAVATDAALQKLARRA